MNNTMINPESKSKVKGKTIYHLFDSSIDVRNREATLPKEYLDNQVTTIYDNDFIGLSKKIIQMYPLSDVQSGYIYAFLFKLDALKLEKSNSEFPDLKHSYLSEDKELILSYYSSNGLHLFSIDYDGDIMVSFSGYSLKKGWREFLNYSPDIFDGDLEKIIYRFLTDVKED